MPRRSSSRTCAAPIAASMLTLTISLPAGAADPIPSYQFATPVFGIETAPDGSLLVADAGAGIVELRKSVGSLVADLPGVTDVSAVGRGSGWAITGIGDPTTELPDSAWGVYQVHGGQASRVADLLDFEKAQNPDGNTAPGGIDSNPFDVQALSAATALVADAGANDLLIVDHNGNVDWIAALPQELVSTANLKSLLTCPDVPAELAFLAFACDLPEMIPAQPVSTSIAIGPDGAYYMAELKGFPAPTNASRIWRVEPGTRHASCQNDPAPDDPCQIVATGFTSIVDLRFGPNGTLYVTEIDEASWAAVEFGVGAQGGTVNACSITPWSCSVLATGLTIPIGTTVGKDGTVYALTEALLPSAKVISLP